MTDEDIDQLDARDRWTAEQQFELEVTLMTKEEILANLPAAVRQVIADAERYKRERDEVIVALKWVMAFDVLESESRANMEALLARIEQADKGTV